MSFDIEDLEEMSDEELMSEFQDGDQRAFNILVNRFDGKLKNYLHRFIQDDHRCEDLTQDVFLRVVQHKEKYKPIAKFSTWLYTIAKNLAKSEIRKKKRAKTKSIQSMNRDNEEYKVEIPDESFAPDDKTQGTIQEEYIIRAVKKLKPRFREAIVLCDIQQLSYDEIEKMTGLPSGTVKSRINRGRKKLRNLLNDIYNKN